MEYGISGGSGQTTEERGSNRQRGVAPACFSSALGWEHINLTGDFHWNVKQTPPNGQFRPLRTKERR